ncbi:MAG: SIR2 family protein [Saprospiraceae bacterium]|nr:SIR2 family protein [Saprospiraceae bacterium]
MYEGEYLHDLLIERFRKELRWEKADSLTTAIRSHINQFNDETKALESLGQILTDFYEDFRTVEIPVYKAISELPFKFIINTSPESLLLEGLKDAGKSYHFFDFHFKRSEYNAEMNKRAVNLDSEIRDDAPLVYNLLGHYSRPDSLVLTDNDRLRFIDVALQREKEATLPSNIVYYCTRPPLQRLRKSYIFAGFDFNEWHLRMLIHLLRRNHDHPPQTLALQDAKVLKGDAGSFFTDNFNVHFTGEDPLLFLGKLKEQLNRPAARSAPAQLELMILYHQKDELLRQEFETYLAPLKNNGIISIWHDAKVMAGDFESDAVIHNLKTSRIIVPLLTANFFDDQRIFQEYLPLALERFRSGEAKLTPIVMTSCDIESSPLFELSTVYPKPKGRAVSQKPDRQETLASIAKELKGMVERMLNNGSTAKAEP